VNRLVSMTALLAIAAAAFAFNAAAVSNKTTARGKSITFHLVEKSIGFNFVDNPPRQGSNAPPLIGDQFALTSALLTRSGKARRISRRHHNPFSDDTVHLLMP
jgi:hypothetical protein